MPSTMKMSSSEKSKQLQQQLGLFTCLHKCKFVLFFCKKRKKLKIGKYRARLIILCYDFSGLQRNGMTAIPKSLSYLQQLKYYRVHDYLRKS